MCIATSFQGKIRFFSYMRWYYSDNSAKRTNGNRCVQRHWKHDNDKDHKDNDNDSDDNRDNDKYDVNED